jgi:drug/metabolite transporter, DME family
MTTSGSNTTSASSPPPDAAAPVTPPRPALPRTALAGYLLALSAGALWGTTGPLSTALYAEGAALTAVGFWRVALATAGFLVYGLFARSLFAVDRRSLLVVGLVGGAMVAVFEVAFQFAIAGVGVAAAVVLLYTAPILVAVLGRVLLGEALTRGRLAAAAVVLAGVALTVHGSSGYEGVGTAAGTARWLGVVGGLLAAASFAGSTLVARWAVPRLGAVRVLFLVLLGGTLLLAAGLPLAGETPVPPAGAGGWLYILGLGLGSVLAANLLYYAAVRRIDAAPTSVAASIEPVVGALLAFLLFGQALTLGGWAGLALVVAGVSSGYWISARATPHPVRPVAEGVPAG